MRIVFVLGLMAHALFAMEYYAKVEPVNSYVIKSSVSGKVVFTNDLIEGKVANNSVIIKIDSYVDGIDLQQTQEKLNVVNAMINIENKNYERLNKVSSKSAFEKDNQKIKVLNLESQKADLLIKIANLKDTLANKNLKEKNSYIYNIAVEKGDYVTPGTLLYETKDLSKGKLAIYIPIADTKVIQEKSIYIDGKKTDFKIHKIYQVADSKHISSYKCEIILPDIKTFPRLVKIEFK